MICNRIVRLIIVTPDMHRVHHSRIISETNSNYGFNLPWWDRIFGSYKAQPKLGHQDMEIITYVISGELEHKDSMGNGSVITAGQFQKMTAGTGIKHSEFNPSSDQEVHLYQIWIEPDKRGYDPSYEELEIESLPENELVLIGGDANEGAHFAIKQDARLYLAKLGPEVELKHNLREGYKAWIQILEGEVTLGENLLYAGDAVAVSKEEQCLFRAKSDAQVMMFEIAEEGLQ